MLICATDRASNVAGRLLLDSCILITPFACTTQSLSVANELFVFGFDVPASVADANVESRVGSSDRCKNRA